MAATQEPATRSEVEPPAVVEILAVVGTVRVWLEPVVARTVSVAPSTAVTTPRMLAKSKPNPPEGRALGLAPSRPPGKPPGFPPVYAAAAQAPLTAGETVTEVAVITPMESTPPVAVTQLPTAMSARLPVLVLLIEVELLNATFTFPPAVLRMSVEPLTLTSTPPVRSPYRNPVEAVPPDAPAVPQETMASPSAAMDALSRSWGWRRSPRRPAPPWEVEDRVAVLIPRQPTFRIGEGGSMAQSRMRIALVAPLIAPLAEPQLGGVQTFLVDLARGLVRRGHDVTVYAPRGSRVDGVTVVEAAVDADALRATLVRPGRRPTQDAAAEERAIQAFAATAALIGSGGFDLVHNHAFDAPAILHAATLATPVVHTLHMPADARIGSALAAAATGANPPLVAAVSEAQAGAWRRLVPVDCVLRPGLPIGSIPWRVTSTSTRLLFAGRFSPEKGALEAVEIARAAGRPLLLCGPEYDPEYAARVRGLLRDGAPSFPPAAVEVRPALERRTLWLEMGRSAAVLCPPAWDEPFGLVAAEANACGTPVVGFRRGGLPEVVEDGVTAILVAPGDVAGAAAGVGRADQLSRGACRRHAEETLDLEATLDAHERAYRRALSSRG